MRVISQPRAKLRQRVCASRERPDLHVPVSAELKSPGRLNLTRRRFRGGSIPTSRVPATKFTVLDLPTPVGPPARSPGSGGGQAGLYSIAKPIMDGPTIAPFGARCGDAVGEFLPRGPGQRAVRRVPAHYEETGSRGGSPADAAEEQRLGARRRILPSDMGTSAPAEIGQVQMINDLITSWPSGARGAGAPISPGVVVPAESHPVGPRAVIWEAVITDPRVAAVSTKGGPAGAVPTLRRSWRRRAALFPRYTVRSSRVPDGGPGRRRARLQLPRPPDRHGRAQAARPAARVKPPRYFI